MPHRLRLREPTELLSTTPFRLRRKPANHFHRLQTIARPTRYHLLDFGSLRVRAVTARREEMSRRTRKALESRGIRDSDDSAVRSGRWMARKSVEPGQRC